MEYLKKSKMYQMAKELLPNVEIPSMARCSYEFYRGSEWLKFSVNLKKYELYHEGNGITVKGWACMDEGAAKKILHKAYCLNTEGKLVKTYEEKRPAVKVRL